MRVDKEFKELIETKARDANLNSTEFVKKCILKSRIVPKKDEVDVAKIALNTTQINAKLEEIALELKDANENNIITDFDFDKMLDYLLDMRLNLRELNNVSVS